MTEFSLGMQLEEVERELALRAKVYLGMVRNGKMRESVAQYHTARMEAVAATLRRLIRERDHVGTAANGDQDGRPDGGPVGAQSADG